MQFPEKCGEDNMHTVLLGTAGFISALLVAGFFALFVGIIFMNKNVADMFRKKANGMSFVVEETPEETRTTLLASLMFLTLLLATNSMMMHLVQPGHPAMFVLSYCLTDLILGAISLYDCARLMVIHLRNAKS